MLTPKTTKSTLATSRSDLELVTLCESERMPSAKLQ
jgi:hypothetical protein